MKVFLLKTIGSHASYRRKIDYYSSLHDIEINKDPLIRCCQCLKLFCAAKIDSDILSKLIDSFFDHWAIIEEVLGESVDEDYCYICCKYAQSYEFEYSPDKNAPFLERITPVFKRILEKGTKRKLPKDLSDILLKTLYEFISNTESPSVCSPLFDLIEPYVLGWLKLDEDCVYLGIWLRLFGWFAFYSKDKQIIYDKFVPLVLYILRSVPANRLIGARYGYLWYFFRFISFDCSHIIDLYDNIKDLLDEWLEEIEKNKKEKTWIKECSVAYISLLSDIKSIVPHLSPKYDSFMGWENAVDKSAHYFDNVMPYVGISTGLHLVVYTIPAIAMIPSLCTHYGDYWYLTHISSWIRIEQGVNQAYYDVLSGEKHGIQLCVASDVSEPIPRINHSSLIQYTPPQHLLVKMTFTEERSMRQSMYDFIEQTGAGVEVLFDDQTHSFEGYNQYGWKEGMEKLEEIHNEK
ncbi:hypothetical protein ADUPG1_013948 [Aduncisulcus paluster]|uniref:Uncharacterized protein n=1 Tax=Aduncisulcus paluster TaxID=2918883 RepID=A0ABQ5K4Z9_9EUKA|nr:hypothetical protein ADUPG1_013948 [Aduncisulcus paluster]